MKATRKPRSVSLSVVFDRPVTSSGFGIMPDGAVRIVSTTPAAVEQAFIETTYERAKGKKVLHRMPVDPSSISLDTVVPLLSFDTLFALDTNTRTIASTRISVAALVLCKWRSRGSTPVLAFAPTQAIELRNTDCSPDLVAWRVFFELLQVNPDRSAMGRVGLIVDAHLGALNAINSKQSPILDDFFLPDGAGLIYASSDVGIVENIVNKLLSHWPTERRQSSSTRSSETVKSRCNLSERTYRTRNIFASGSVTDRQAFGRVASVLPGATTVGRARDVGR